MRKDTLIDVNSCDARAPEFFPTRVTEKRQWQLVTIATASGTLGFELKCFSSIRQQSL